MNSAVTEIIIEENNAPNHLDQIPPIEETETFLPEANDLSLRLTLTDQGARLEKDSDPSFFKNISLKSLAKVILDNASLDTMMLPLYGKDYIGIRRYLQVKDKHILLVESSPGIRTANYFPGSLDEPRPYQIPHPGLLMAITLKEESNNKFKVEKTRLFALKTPAFTESTQLYRFPYGNVYTAESGRICWGAFERDVFSKKYNNIMQSAELLNLFLSTGYNNDLFYKENLPLKTASNFEEVFTFMQENEYPYDTLKQSIKVGELISLIINN